MTNRKNFNTSKIPRTTTVFPQAVVANNLVFVSGTTGIDPSTGKLSEDFEQQARQAFANLAFILEEARSSLKNIVKTTVFMVAGNDFSILNKVYADVFPEEAPARSVPQVMPFPGGVLISVECIALV